MILILNGSPNKEGNTVTVLKEILKNVADSYIMINVYEENIAPCDDCKFCNYKSGCSKKDKMLEVYKHLDSIDTLVIASPLYFAALSGELLNLISRFQTYFSSKYLRKQSVPMLKKGLLLVTAGGYWESMFAGVKETFKVLKLLFDINATMDLLIPDCDKEKPLEKQNVTDKLSSVITFINDK